MRQIAEPKIERMEEQVFEASDEARRKADPLIGQTLVGNYQVIDLLGEGGMALVYTGKQISTDRLVALKTLKTRDVDVLRRFEREMKTHAKLNHKNIVEAIDCFESNEQSFLVMEFVKGSALGDVIEDYGGIEKEEDIASVLSQICDALDHAHSHQIIHRDLKPANIIVVEREEQEPFIKVLDFGIAKLQDDMQKLTAEGQALGSPLYMSPEQCMGKELSPRADLYSLGIVAYEVVTGNLPYEFERLVQIMKAHCDPEYRPQSIATHRPDLKGVTQLNQIIMRAVETEPDKRFQTAAEFKKAIQFWIQSVRGGTEQALPRDIATAAKPAKPNSAQQVQEKQDKAVQELVANRAAGKAPRAAAPVSPKAATDPSSTDTTRLIVNFSIGLGVCCATLIVIAGIIINFESIKNVWLSASQQVSNVLAKKPETPPERKRIEPNPAYQLPDYKPPATEVQPNLVPTGDQPSPPPSTGRKRRIL
ncbi:MAG: serine/threonine-protein kinase [Candidatus Melainabacteria bacterium]|nr:serine/threonine-protein kinase [Candidatus Melainabacteria bacterium]